MASRKRAVKLVLGSDPIKEYLFREENPTVSSLLERAEVDPEGCEILVNDEPANLETALENADIVAVTPPIEGG